MAMLPVIEDTRWYETLRLGDGVTLIHEPWIKPFFRCNVWHVRGRDRDLLFDTGLGHVSLRRQVPLVSERKLVCVASHTVATAEALPGMSKRPRRVSTATIPGAAPTTLPSSSVLSPMKVAENRVAGRA